MDPRTRILVVDDNPQVRIALERVLCLEGYEVASAATGAQALDAVKAGTFDLAILDLRLPDMTGLALLGAIKEVLPDLGAIIVSGYSAIDQAGRAINLGADAYIAKPIDVEELRAVIQRTLERRILTVENRRLLDQVRQEQKRRRRGAALVSQLMAFSRNAPLSRRPLDLGPLIAETVEILRRTMPENVRILEDISDEVPAVRTDATHIQQVLLNLATNARDAMPGGGDLLLRLDSTTLMAATAAENGAVPPGTYARISVRDSGQGMTEEVLQHAFDPFFTTKEVGQGTGLGLASVYGVVRCHGGFLQVSTSVGRGTEFRVLLPIASEAVPVLKKAPEAGVVGGSETILLVEDDLAVQDISKEILESLGYAVIVAHDGEEGLRLYRERRGDIHLILSDMMMPGMGGRDLFRAVWQEDPAARVLLVTGHSVEEDLRQMLDQGLVGFLCKPYRIHELAGAVRRAIDTPVPPTGSPHRDPQGRPAADRAGAARAPHDGVAACRGPS